MIMIKTDRRAHYRIHDDGNIERTDMRFTPSGQWRLLGVCRVKPFGNLGPLEPLAPLIERGERLTFKNGTGRFAIVDYDHGTRRIWGERLIGAWIETE